VRFGRQNRNVATVISSGLLLVHDNVDWLRLACGVLRSDGFDVVTAPSGAAALHQVNEGFRPAVVVASLRLPGIGGLELAGAIRDLDGSTGVILLTDSVPRPDDLVSISPASVMIEPCDPVDLVECVHSTISNADLMEVVSSPDTPCRPLPWMRERLCGVWSRIRLKGAI
jgi:CheY-like chemotaxis protein